jgi:hypothetical protein
MSRFVSLAVVSSLFFAACAAPTEEVTAAVDADATGTRVFTVPTKLPADDGTGGGGSTSGSTCGAQENQCFGAVGSRCTGAPADWPVPDEPAFWHVGCTADGWCWVNAGSWQHDECCFDNPDGRWCNGPVSEWATTCSASWERANHRLEHGLDWKRRVDRCRIDDDGAVDFAEYCAPNGTILASNDANRCCSGLSRAYDASLDSMKAQTQGVRFDGSFIPVVCKAPPAPAGSVTGTQKYCIKM